MRLSAALCLVPLAVSAAQAPAPADGSGFVDQANQAYSSIRPEKRSDAILLPLLAKLQPAPAVTAEAPELVPPTASGFGAAAAWATGEPQKAALAALKRVAQDPVLLRGFAWGQPYGEKAVAAGQSGPEIAASGLFTDLGEPPMLAAARFRALPALERLATLAHVEATRLQGEGKPAEAIAVMIDLAYLGRQLVDRQFLPEADQGYRMMELALERVRDVAYVDFRSGSPKLTVEDILAAQERLREDGYVRTDLLNIPQGHRLAAEQAVAMTFGPSGQPDAATFPIAMARGGSAAQPLRLFSEAARWEGSTSGHADRAATLKAIADVHGDWAQRWRLDPFDQRNTFPTDYSRLDASRLALVKAVVPDLGVLFAERMALRAQLTGTRAALGVVAFHLRSKNFPPLLSSIAPNYMRAVEADPYNPIGGQPARRQLEYFVPVRDAGRGAPSANPHEMNVHPRRGEAFKVTIGPDGFVLYSVGPDGGRDFAREAHDAGLAGESGDVLLWPPVISLEREHRVKAGEFK